MKLNFILILVNFILVAVVYAQEVTPEATVDPESIADINVSVSEITAYFETEVIETTLGMPIPVKLVVEMPAGYSLVGEFEDIFEDPFEIVDTEEVVTREQGNLQIIEQELSVVAWELDTLTTEEIFVRYQTPSGEQFRSPITSITINVTSTRTESDIALRPLRPLIDMPFIPAYVYAIPVIIIILGIFLVRNIQFNRRLQRALATPDSPVQRAIVDLKHLLDTNATVEEIYPFTADAVRQYLTEQFHIRAVDMTTIELMQALQANPIFSDTLRTSLKDLLEQADLVKFASHHPAVPPESVIDYAIRWIEQAERARILHE